jgi:hypothetical protein
MFEARVYPTSQQSTQINMHCKIGEPTTTTTIIVVIIVLATNGIVVVSDTMSKD